MPSLPSRKSFMAGCHNIRWDEMWGIDTYNALGKPPNILSDSLLSSGTEGAKVFDDEKHVRSTFFAHDRHFLAYLNADMGVLFVFQKGFWTCFVQWVGSLSFDLSIMQRLWRSAHDQKSPIPSPT